MTNGAFLLLSEEEKHSKFKAVLKNKTQGCLTGEELREILLSVLPNRQYCIKVYWDKQDFCQSLASDDGSWGRTILGQVMAGQGQTPGLLFCETRAAAVLIRKQADEGETYQIHIFIPPERLQKGFQKQ